MTQIQRLARQHFHDWDLEPQPSTLVPESVPHDDHTGNSLYGKQEFDRKIAESYENGRIDGAEAATRDVEERLRYGLQARQTEALERIADALDSRYRPLEASLRDQLDQHLNSWADRLRATLLPLMTPLLLEKIETLTETFTRVQQRQNTPCALTLFAHTDTHTDLMELMKSQADTTMFDLCADNHMKRGQCRIDWNDGAVLLDTDTAFQALTEALRALPHPPLNVPSASEATDND